MSREEEIYKNIIQKNEQEALKEKEVLFTEHNFGFNFNYQISFCRN